MVTFIRNEGKTVSPAFYEHFFSDLNNNNLAQFIDAYKSLRNQYLPLRAYELTLEYSYGAVRPLIRHHDIFNNLDNMELELAVSILSEIPEEALEEEDIEKIEDLELSVNSPYDIDLSKIREAIESSNIADKTAAEKFLCIYKKLTESPSYKSLFTDLFEENKNINAAFEIVDSLSVSIGGSEPNAKAITKNRQVDSNGNLIKADVKILINKKILELGTNKTSSVISIAKTIIHESIHAYLSLKMKDCNAGMTLDDLSNMEFEELIDEYYDGTCKPKQSQHEFVFDYMIPKMIQILKEIKDNLIIESHREYAEDITFVIDNVNYPFEWNDFFYYISLRGVDRTESFENEIEGSSLKEGLYRSYVNLDNGFSKNCN